jgi:hypothetical protein
LKEKLISEKYPSLCNDTYAYYSPGHINRDWKADNPYGIEYYPKIDIYFQFGEDLYAKFYVEDQQETRMSSRYHITITEKRGKNILKILPPKHHVREPPYNDATNISSISDSASVKYVCHNVPTTNGTLRVDRKSKCKAKTLNDIYGNILKEVRDFFINERNMWEMLAKCKSLHRVHNANFIAGAKAAVFMFLMIGRFRSSIPYDLIRMIAKKVWESRYNKDVWGVGDVTINTRYMAPDYRTVPSNSYDEDSYIHYEDECNGWTPYYFHKKNVFTNYKIPFQWE